MVDENYNIYLYVDGYNIINSWKVFEDNKRNNLEEARENLIDILAEYQAFSGYDITLVFDAHLVKSGSKSEEEKKGLKIVYTEENETADHYIEKVAQNIGRKETMIVATSDYLEQTIVMAKGAIRMSARELEIKINHMNEELERAIKRNCEIIDYEFGELDDKAIKALKNISLDKDNIK